MYQSKYFCRDDEETFSLEIPTDKDYKILQLTDLHLGFGPLSRKKDRLALNAVTKVIEKSSPDLIVLTGDSIFPFLPKSGTLNNKKQAEKFIAFMDEFAIPYTMVLGNHDCEAGAVADKNQIGDIFSSGRFSVFSKGRRDISGVGNFFINLVNAENMPLLTLVMLDSNMYGNGWFYSGFDCIHEDQTEWCMKKLDLLKKKNSRLEALAFFHMPVQEFKEAYEKMKLGDTDVTYHLGSICEDEQYFGISAQPGTFFKRAVENGTIKGMFCGHDHLNTISLTYCGIRLTYGMSIDFLGYKGIHKKHTQRGGTLITRKPDGKTEVSLVPLNRVVSSRIRGVK